MKNNKEVASVSFTGRRKGNKQNSIDKTLKVGGNIAFLEPLTSEEKEAIRKDLFDLKVETSPVYSSSRGKLVGVAIIGILGTFDCIPILGRVWEKNGKIFVEKGKDVLQRIFRKMGYAYDPIYLAFSNPECYAAIRWGYLSVTKEQTRANPYVKPSNNLLIAKEYFTHSAGIDKWITFTNKTGKRERIRYKKENQEGACRSYVRRRKALRDQFYRQTQKMQKKGYYHFLKTLFEVKETEEDRKNGLYFHGTLEGKWVLSYSVNDGDKTFKKLDRNKIKSNYVQITRNYQPEKDENNFFKFLKPSTGIYQAVTYYPEHTDSNLAEHAMLMLVALNGGSILNLAENEFDPTEIPIPYDYPR